MKAWLFRVLFMVMFLFGNLCEAQPRMYEAYLSANYANLIGIIHVDFDHEGAEITQVSYLEVLDKEDKNLLQSLLLTPVLDKTTDSAVFAGESRIQKLELIKVIDNYCSKWLLKIANKEDAPILTFLYLKMI